MRGRTTAAILFALVGGFITVVPCTRIIAAPSADSAIAVAGNRRIDAAMIRSFFHVGADGRLDDGAVDAALKGLYGTGLFQDVKISRQGDHVLVTVVENPMIERMAFEGNKKIKDEDLRKVVESKERGPLSRALVHNDVEHIIEVYRQHGYFDVRVEPKTIDVKNKLVNLIFEIKEGDKLAVKQIQFAGNASYTQSKLKSVIKTGETNLLSFLLNNDIYDADRIENDRDLIRRFYLAHGYADVRVRSTGSYEAEKKGVVITFVIEEGQQYRFGKVEIESDLRFVDATAMRAYLRTREGEIYDADAVQKTVEDVTIELAKSGQPFATVLPRSERMPDRRIINLVFAVVEGRRVYIERIDIHGNSKTRDDVIRREFDCNEGDAYNRALIDRGERRLKRLGYFKTVKITTQPGSAADRIVVDVTIEEDRTGDFTISGGYSTAAGALAQISIMDKNLLGSGLNAKLSVTYGEYARGGSISVIDPYVFDRRIALGGELFATETLASSYQSFNSLVYGAKLSVGTPLNDELGVQWNYSIYNQSLSLDPSQGVSSLPIQQAAAAGPMWVSSVGSSVTYSTLDNPKSPTSGIRAQFNSEFAGLGGAVNFARTTNDVRYYHQIVGDIVGMVRAQGGYVTPWGGQQLPLLDNFFGGPQLVRGFAPNGFGPRDITPGTTQDNVGGNVYWTTSSELQAPMPLVPPEAQLKVALFADAGSLWANGASSVPGLAALSPSQQIANSHAIRASLGGSLIWDSMFGPIRVDYAYPVAKQSYDVTQRLNFSAGAF